MFNGTLPLVVELDEVPDMERAFCHLSNLPHCLFLDSAMQEADLGRYSFLTADPFDVVMGDGSVSSPINLLQEKLQTWQA